MISETSFAVAGVVEAEGYDHGVRDDWGELCLSLVSKYFVLCMSVKEGAYGRSHAPTLQIASQAIDVIVPAADNVAVGIEGFPLEAAGIMTDAFDLG